MVAAVVVDGVVDGTVGGVVVVVLVVVVVVVEVVVLVDVVVDDGGGGVGVVKVTGGSVIGFQGFIGFCGQGL